MNFPSLVAENRRKLTIIVDCNCLVYKASVIPTPQNKYIILLSTQTFAEDLQACHKLMLYYFNIAVRYCSKPPTLRRGNAKHHYAELGSFHQNRAIYEGLMYNFYLLVILRCLAILPYNMSIQMSTNLKIFVCFNITHVKV